jgi:hypothetical protein
MVYIKRLEKNSAKAPKYFMCRAVLIYHPVFPVISEIGTADVWIILDFRTMEDTKVKYWSDRGSPHLYVPLNKNQELSRY